MAFVTWGFAMRATVLAAAALHVGVGTRCVAQVPDEPIEARLNRLFEARYPSQSPGAAVLISKGDSVVYHGALGMADIEHGIQIDEHTRFPIGSITKQFTAAAVLRLAEERLLALSDPISSHLPAVSAEWASITIEQLLTHSSGIPDYPRVASVRRRLREDLSVEEILELVMAEPLEFAAGKRVTYSNTGYVVLGKIIEAASDRPYADYLDDLVFKPLGMTQTVVGHHTDIIPQRARGYAIGETDVLVNATYHTSSYSAGAIVSTTRDLIRWISGLRSGRVLAQGSLKTMFSNYRLSNDLITGLGLGWELNELAGHSSFEHSGFEPGYKANSLYVPDDDLYVVVLQNSEEGSPTPSMINAAAIALGQPYPDPSQEVVLPPAVSTSLVGTYEFPDGRTRVVGLSDGAFFYRAPGGRRVPIYAVDEQTLIFEEGYRQLVFKPDASGTTVGLRYRNRAITEDAVKTGDQSPEEKVEIEVAPEILESYVGIYQLEAFQFTVLMEEGVLLAQPEGAESLPLIPSSETTFFIREIGAEIEFDVQAGETAITIVLEGERMTGVRR